MHGLFYLPCPFLFITIFFIKMIYLQVNHVYPFYPLLYHCLPLSTNQRMQTYMTPFTLSKLLEPQTYLDDAKIIGLVGILLCNDAWFAPLLETSSSSLQISSSSIIELEEIKYSPQQTNSSPSMFSSHSYYVSKFCHPSYAN